MNQQKPGGKYLFQYQNKSDSIILPGVFGELDEVCSEVPEDSRVLRVRCLYTRPPIASKPGSSPPEQTGLDNITSQP